MATGTSKVSKNAPVETAMTTALGPLLKPLNSEPTTYRDSRVVVVVDVFVPAVCRATR